jgi:hypothetical protein
MRQFSAILAASSIGTRHSNTRSLSATHEEADTLAWYWRVVRLLLVYTLHCSYILHKFIASCKVPILLYYCNRAQITTIVDSISSHVVLTLVLVLTKKSLAVMSSSSDSCARCVTVSEPCCSGLVVGQKMGQSLTHTRPVHKAHCH